MVCIGEFVLLSRLIIFIINLLNNYSIKTVRFYVCFSQYYCCIDEWMKYLHPLEGESLTMYTILQAMLPSADLSLFCGQEELLALGLSLLLSYKGDEILYTWISNPVPISLINNLRRYKKISH